MDKTKTDILQEAQKIAAVVLFKDLHSKKMDLYDVLAAFIRDIIIGKSLSKFTTIDMSKYLVESYGFDSIPQNVIKIGIKRTGYVNLIEGSFVVNRKKIKDKEEKMGEVLEEEIAKNDDIISGLCKYIENRKNIKLCQDEKKIVIKSFCGFLLDSTYDNKYIAEITSYIVTLDGTPAQKRIDEITEGVCQYAALTYNGDMSKIDKLKNEMTIFLDTEALLSFGGFHGEVHKQYIDEMLQLINEVNVKIRKKVIFLKYMDYVKMEIDDVFNAAVFYVKGKNYYTRDAAESIAEGCKTEEDIMMKRANFYARLKSAGIYEFPFAERYSDVNKKYNLEGDSELRNLLSDEISEKDIEKGAKRVNDVYKLRRGVIYKNFEEIRYLFISDNGKAQSVNAYFCKSFNSYNFIMGSAKLTNILWIKMNKGLANATLPSSLKAVTRSKVVVSSFISAKMKSEMKTLNYKIESGELEREALYEMISDFKHYAKHPEDITADSVDMNLNYIESEMKTYGEELSLYKSKAETERQKRDDVVSAFKQYSVLGEKREILLKKKEETELKMEMLNKNLKRGKYICVAIKCMVVVVCFFVLWFIIRLINKETVVEWISNREWLFSIGLIIVFWTISIVVEKKFNCESLKNKLFDKIHNDIYKRFGAACELIDNCVSLLEGINNEINEVEIMMENYKKQIE